MRRLKIVMIGSGNLATHLSKALTEKNHQIIQVYSRNPKSAEYLANIVGARSTSDLKMIKKDADFYIISVTDSAIHQVIKNISFINKKIVHTAGSVSISAFGDVFTNAGVFYPLQTFSKSRNVNFSEVPICIEAKNEEFESFLVELASQISGNVLKISSDQRKYLHLSAVFANNFVNHLYFIAKELILKENIDFKILFPLIKETTNKVFEMDPKLAQTGPAIRNDKESLKKHLELLSSSPVLQLIYKAISKDIYLKNKVL